ncbi:cupin domain-containing protein [Nonomuraea pusilla]|uniref:cupin domain-containing protein n=1 Tax=Nonomuraea pusilla TaxID=46177 RepID=UPI0033241A89
MDPVSAARSLLDELFPDALYAFLGGSAITERRTSTSDLDVVVVVEGLTRPYRESRLWRELPVELLVHGETSLAEYAERDFARREPVLAHLCAYGVVLADRSGGRADALRATLRRRLEQGPPELGRAARERARYVLSDLLDDLKGATDPGELAFIRSTLLMETARVALDTAFDTGPAWRGGGKWLLRALQARDPALAERLTAAHHDDAALAAIASDVLERAGGRLWEGYRAEGDPFHRPLRHIAAESLSGDTAQSSGMRRLAAVSGATAGSDRLWMGQTHVAPATRSSDHHHGASETAIYVVSGTPSFVFLDGEREVRLDTRPGDYVFVPPYTPHREENPDPEVEAVVVIARSTQEAVVVNLPDLRPR